MWSLPQSGTLSWATFDVQRKDLRVDAFLTWNVVGNQMKPFSCALKKESSGMLKKECFSSLTSQMGVTHVPSVLPLLPMVCAPCLCWLTYLPSIKGRGNYGAVKTNMSEEYWIFGRGQLGNGCHHHCPLKPVDIWARTWWPPTDIWQHMRDLWVSERVPALAPECTRQRRAGHNTLLHDPAPQGQLPLLLCGGGCPMWAQWGLSGLKGRGPTEFW